MLTAQRLALIVCALIIAMFLVTHPVFGQGQLATASLSGTVRDTTQAIVPAAGVTLENLEGGAPYTTRTNDVGIYTIPQVRPGHYRLRVTKQGFADAVISDVTLSVSQAASIDVTLSTGTLEQQVVVTAAAVEIQSQDAELSGTVTTRTAVQMPLTLRDTTQLVSLVPGVTADLRLSPAGDVQAGLGGLLRDSRLDFSINGGQRQSAAEVVDGIDVTYAGEFYPQTPVIISPDFTNEMKVHTNSLPAEFGPGAGVVNIATRSGTNNYHGSLFEFLQNDKLNANNFFSNSRGVARAPQHRNQYGFAAGGPVIRNKFFLFGDWEQLKNRKGQSILTSVPTAAERGGDFRDLTTTSGAQVVLYNPFDTYVDTDGRVKRRPFAVGNCITCSGLSINQFAQKLLSYYPNPNNVGLLDVNGKPTQLSNLFVVGNSPNDYDRFDVKGDYDMSSSSRLMARVSRNQFSGFPVNVLGNVANSNALSGRDYRDTDWNAVLSWTWIASTSLVLTQSASYTRVAELSINDSFGFDPTTLGGPFADGRLSAFSRSFNGGTSFPNMQISGYAPMGNNGIGYNYVHNYPTFVYQIGIVKTSGHHTLKAGFKFALHQTFENYLNGYTGTYSWSGSWTNGPDPLAPSANTGNSIADMELGLIGGGSMQTGTADALTSKYFGWYVQDDWRLTPKLTVNLGLRYDFEIPFTDRYNMIARFDTSYSNPLGTKSGPNSNGTLNDYFTKLVGRPLVGAVIFPSVPGASRQVVNTDYKVIQPRLGLAYSINNSLVFRAGFSRLAFQSPSVASLAALNGGGATAVTSITPTVNGIDPVLNLENVYPTGFLTPLYDKQGALSLVGQSVSMPTTISRTPNQWQWNAGFEYAVGHDGVLSLAYAGSATRHLICATGQCSDQIPIDTVMHYGSQLLQTVPNPFYGIITDPTSALSRPTVQFSRLLARYPQFTGWTGVAPNTYQGLNGEAFHSNWNALEVGFRKSYGQGLTAMLAYTWSKNLTNVDGPDGGWLGPSGRYQNLVDFTNEYSLSAEDVPHRLVIAHVYDLPFGKGKTFGSNWNPVVNGVLGGWQISGVVTFQSGFPLPVSVSGVTTGTTGTVRPNMVAGMDPCGDTGRSRADRIAQYMNPAAFTVPANFTFGNAPRILNCRGDAVKNWDAAVIKQTSIRESTSLEFRADFFNAFNRVQLGLPNTTFNGSSFGRITSAYNQPRVIQFGMKLKF
jgi:hypothetical protein